MKTTIGILFVSFCLLIGGNAIAGDQNDLPEILASAADSESVVLLDDGRMEQIEGTFFLPNGHPSLKASICGFWRNPRRTIRLHLEAWLPEGHPTLRRSICGFKADPIGTLKLHLCNNIQPR